jgi:hypothetical protein
VAHAHALHDLIVNEIDRGVETPQAREIVDPETHACALFRGELSCQTPADAGISEMIDDPTENVPRMRLAHIAALHRQTSVLRRHGPKPPKKKPGMKPGFSIRGGG